MKVQNQLCGWRARTCLWVASLVLGNGCMEGPSSDSENTICPAISVPGGHATPHCGSGGATTDAGSSSSLNENICTRLPASTETPEAGCYPPACNCQSTNWAAACKAAQYFLQGLPEVFEDSGSATALELAAMAAELLEVAAQVGPAIVCGNGGVLGQQLTANCDTLPDPNMPDHDCQVTRNAYACACAVGINSGDYQKRGSMCDPGVCGCIYNYMAAGQASFLCRTIGVGCPSLWAAASNCTPTGGGSGGTAGGIGHSNI